MKIDYKIWGKDELPYGPCKRRLETIGLNEEDSKHTLALISFWLKCNGPVGYLECVTRQGTAWKQVFSGDYKVIHGCTRTKGMIPVRTAYLRKYKVSIVLRVMKFMKNLITFTRILPSQWHKFHNSATRQHSPREFLRKYGLVVRQGAKPAVHKDELSWDVPLPITEFVNSRVGNKTFSPFDSRTSVPRQPFDVVVDSLKVLREGPFNTFHLLPFLGSAPYISKPETAGLVGCTQEPGGKARFFVSVHPAYQSGFTPLQRALKFRARRDKCSYAFNQDLGRERVRRALQSGRTVYSFDLSDATNNFPLALQTEWMWSSMLDPSQIVSFIEVSKMPYKTSQEIFDTFGIDTVTFTNGQPLGLLPSAMAFHLTHIYLLRGLEIELYGKPRNQFAVVVDDVAIWDHKLAKAYETAMDELEVPISKGKSLVSNKASEFLGRFITADRVIELTKQLPMSLSNVMHYSRTFGIKAIDELRMGKAKANTLRKLAALPSFMGGADAGNGLSLPDRCVDPAVQPWLQAISDRRKVVSNQYDPDLLTDRVRSLVRLVRESGARLRPGLDDYLSSLLPRFRSILPAVWYCVPGGKVIKSRETASLTQQYLSDPTKGMLIRKDSSFDEVSQLHKSESFRHQIIEENKASMAALTAFINAVV